MWGCRGSLIFNIPIAFGGLCEPDVSIRAGRDSQGTRRCSQAYTLRVTRVGGVEYPDRICSLFREPELATRHGDLRGIGPNVLNFGQEIRGNAGEEAPWLEGFQREMLASLPVSSLNKRFSSEAVRYRQPASETNTRLMDVVPCIPSSSDSTRQISSARARFNDNEHPSQEHLRRAQRQKRQARTLKSPRLPEACPDDAWCHSRVKKMEPPQSGRLHLLFPQLTRIAKFSEISESRWIKRSSLD